MARIKYKQGINFTGEIEGYNQDEDDDKCTEKGKKYALSNIVVTILVGTDRHGHDNIHIISMHTNSQSIIIISLYVPIPSYITINSSNSNRRGRRRTMSSDVPILSFDHTVY